MFYSLINHNFEVSERLFIHNVNRDAQVALTEIRTGFCNVNYDLLKDVLIIRNVHMVAPKKDA